MTKITRYFEVIFDQFYHFSMALYVIFFFLKYHKNLNLGILDACSGWIIVTLVGLMAGCAAALIGIR